MTQIMTNEGNHQDAEKDTKGVAQDVHEHDWDESHRQIKLALSLLAPPPTQNLTRILWTRASIIFDSI